MRELQDAIRMTGLRGFPLAIKTRWIKLYFAFIFMSVFASTAVAESSSGPITVEQIAKAWQNRELQTRTIRATWINERTYTKFWANCHVPLTREEYVTLRFRESSFLLDGDKLRFDSGDVDASGNALQFDGSRRLDDLGRVQHNNARRVFQDDRLRYDTARKRVDPRNPTPSDWPRNLRSFTTIFDGKRNLQFLPDERGEYPEVYLFRSTQNLYRRSLYYLPMVLTFRPGWLELSPQKCRLNDKPKLLSDRQCLVFVDETGLKREYWLDPERDFIVLRYVEDCDVLGARMKNRFDIQYSQTPDGKWIPSTWTTVFIDNHGLMEQYAVSTVNDASVNDDHDQHLFELDLPSKTWVFDEATDTHALVQSDGKLRPISRAELDRGSTHVELSGSGSLLTTVKQYLTSVRDLTFKRNRTAGILAGGLAICLLVRLVRTRGNSKPI